MDKTNKHIREHLGSCFLAIVVSFGSNKLITILYRFGHFYVDISTGSSTGLLLVQTLDFSMITSQLLASDTVFCVLNTSSLDTFIAAVYKYAVILPNDTLPPVSREEVLVLVSVLMT